ncbi:hypothetical protein ACFY2R_26635 [Micromonospora olivasterospora]|uniref:hypothetical protein n=1 Tax=Micromonospora olivasterospora TaxID=1880 RepID=UPI001FE76AF1|nr:hypothetical protein [Micromonospora olivasterospora]
MTARDASFAQVFAQFMRDTGRWRDCEPDALLARWSGFVESCIRGYKGDAEDYFNDLTARDGLERAMRESALAHFPELDDLRRAALEIDEEFRRILRTDAFPRAPMDEWWNRGIVSYAGARLVEELSQTYGINIDLV